MEYVIFYLIFCAIVAMAGNGKVVGYWGVFLWSILLTPLIGFIIGTFSKSVYRRNLENEAYHNMANPKSQQNIASELEKLHQLKERGVMSEDEYQQAKNKLLN